MIDQVPPDAPPSYAQATGSSASSHPAASSSSNPHSTTSPTSPSHLNVPASSKKGKDGIPTGYRRSMEDEMRPLPEGWVRTFDPNHKHQFYVDTTKDPPVSIWEHPYDNEDYLKTLASEERERIEQDKVNRAHDEYIHSLSDMDDDDHRFSTSAAVGSAASSSQANPELPPRPDGKGKGPDNRTFGRKLKDKMTGMSHEQREEIRRQRYAEEQRIYETHLRVREAMQRAMQTGQPQWVGKDRDGKDVYIEPPAPYGGYGPSYGGGYPYGSGYGYSPYQNGVYTTPNARYIRPQQAYGRPGSGMALPLALGGGLLGGALLGSLMF